MTNYLFNTTIVPPAGNCTVSFTKLTVEQAKSVFFGFNVCQICGINPCIPPDSDDMMTHVVDWSSSIGHEATAQVLSQLFETSIRINRRNNLLEVGDKVLAFKLKTRLDEGTVLSVEALKELEYEFWLMEVEETTN